jgi:hypothetical protein
MHVGRIAACLVLMMGLAAPVVAKGPETVFSNYRLNYVKIRAATKKERRSAAFAHPAQIPSEKIAEMLSAIRLSRRAFFKKSKVVHDREVFSQKAIDDLAEPIAHALQQATNNQLVTFSYLFKNPRVVMRNDKFSSGRLWMEADGLHITFDKINAHITSDLDKRGYSDKSVGRARGLRTVLEPGPGMVYGKTQSELILTPSATFVAAGGGNVRMPKKPSKRLKELERLKEMGLISGEEFEAKRRAILNQL